jgi:hypothetical protein
MIFIGVLMFSYIMNEFNDILVKLKASQQDFDEGDKLKQFLGVLIHFNENEQVNYKKDFEDYFTHRWNSYKNLAF